ncbi:MAG: transglycosylase SLT domain-containing protein [Parcubacteria group bacterium]|nr:transglycosylase SLT domain-containing protein [Parcubacteria group bacterium]
MLFCLVALSLPVTPSHAKAEKKSGVTDQTEEKQKGSPKVVLVEEIISDHKDAIKKESVKTGVPPAVLVAIIAAESANNPKAVSAKDARGLMQTRSIADKTTKVQCEATNNECQIRKGARYIQHLVEKEGIPKWSRVFLAYNEGPTGSKRFRTPKSVLAHNYVKKCNDYLQIAHNILND